MPRPGGASRQGFLANLPLFDLQGTTLVLGTAAGSVTVPTNPRPHGVILFPTASAEDYIRLRVNTASGAGTDGYLGNGGEYQFSLDSRVTSINARVASGAGTLNVTWVFSGTV